MKSIDIVASLVSESKFVCHIYRTDSNRSQKEVLVEVPGVSVNITKAQVLMLLDIYQSWLAEETNQTSWCQETSLMEDVFKPSGEETCF